MTDQNRGEAARRAVLQSMAALPVAVLLAQTGGARAEATAGGTATTVGPVRVDTKGLA